MLPLFNDAVDLWRSLLTQGTVEQATDVLLEEAGHAIDDFVNNTDTPSNEGDILVSLVQGNELSDRTFSLFPAPSNSISFQTIIVDRVRYWLVPNNGSGDGNPSIRGLNFHGGYPREYGYRGEHAKFADAVLEG